MDKSPGHRVVTTTARPDLAPLVTQWLWDAFWRDTGKAFAQLLDAADRTAKATGPIPQTFVVLVDGGPVGTASLIANDLDERPELSPWLAGVFVEPERHGRALATSLVRAVESSARDSGVRTLWLHTKTAERLYTRLDWRRVEQVPSGGKPSTLMRRDL